MAEICLITGTPGSGKTLKMVSMMANDEMFKPDENGIRRKVFTNIKGLKIPHTYIETDAKKLPKSTDEQLSAHDMYEWIKKPENIGSIVIVDEAQDVWPARSAGSKIPENVQWLNTHRHQGIDIFVLTQGSKLLDQNLRTLVRKHYHIASNKMGMRTLLEWKICADDPVKMASSAFSSIYTLDKKVYDLYESAEVHTVNKVKRSKWFYTLPVIILLIPVFVGLSYKMLSSYGKKQEEPAA
ncbi:TPA: zonular occludens toxin family protein, partial [Neisseria meningitidis]